MQGLIFFQNKKGIQNHSSEWININQFNREVENNVTWNSIGVSSLVSGLVDSRDSRGHDELV